MKKVIIVMVVVAVAIGVGVVGTTFATNDDATPPYFSWGEYGDGPAPNSGDGVPDGPGWE